MPPVRDNSSDLRGFGSIGIYQSPFIIAETFYTKTIRVSLIRCNGCEIQSVFKVSPRFSVCGGTPVIRTDPSIVHILHILSVFVHINRTAQAFFLASESCIGVQ